MCPATCPRRFMVIVPEPKAAAEGPSRRHQLADRPGGHRGRPAALAPPPRADLAPRHDLAARTSRFDLPPPFDAARAHRVDLTGRRFSRSLPDRIAGNRSRNFAAASATTSQAQPTRAIITVASSRANNMTPLHPLDARRDLPSPLQMAVASQAWPHPPRQLPNSLESSSECLCPSSDGLVKTICLSFDHRPREGSCRTPRHQQFQPFEASSPIASREC